MKLKKLTTHAKVARMIVRLLSVSAEYIRRILKK